MAAPCAEVLPSPLPGRPGLPLAAAAVEPLAAPQRTAVRRAARRGIPVRVSAPAGTRVLVALRRGERRLTARRAVVGALGARVVRLRVRGRPGALRIVVTATGADGRQSSASRRIVLTRR